MPAKKRSLQAPPAVYDDPKSFEIARIWAAGGKQHVTLAAELWDDPHDWGIMLVDLARHVANAYEQLRGIDSRESMSQIKEGFEIEWSHPTEHNVRGRVRK